VYRCVEVPITATSTADELRHQLVAVGTDLLVDALAGPLGTPQPQVGDTTYAAKLHSDELQIDWAKPAATIDRLIRLGGAYTTFRGKRLRIHAAELLAERSEVVDDELHGGVVGGLRLTRVQPEGKPPMAFHDFANGARPQPGERLGQ
jgi:methionyl-tRNA formyltransferase